MASKTWQIYLDGTTHEVTVDTWWLGVRRIYLNGQAIPGEATTLERGKYGEYHFLFFIGDHQCWLGLKIDGPAYRFGLEIDGRDASDFSVPRDILLRPAESPVTSSDVLLRPAASNLEATPPQELLRAADTPDSRKS